MRTFQLRNVNSEFSRFGQFWVDKIVGADWTLFYKSVSGIKVINVCIVIYRYIGDRWVILSSRERRTSK